MTRPRGLWRLEWEAARHPDRPADRKYEARNYTSAMNAGDQVAKLRLWVPKYVEIHGCWHTAGGRSELEWAPVDLDLLPVSDVVAWHVATLRQHSPTYAETMGEA